MIFLFIYLFNRFTHYQNFTHPKHHLTQRLPSDISDFVFRINIVIAGKYAAIIFQRHILPQYGLLVQIKAGRPFSCANLVSNRLIFTCPSSRACEKGNANLPLTNDLPVPAPEMSAAL
jgi:hypothetical protein